MAKHSLLIWSGTPSQEPIKLWIMLFISPAARLLSEIPGVGLGIGVVRGLTTVTMLGINAGMESAIAIS